MLLVEQILHMHSYKTILLTGGVYMSWWGNEELFRSRMEMEDLNLIGDHQFTIGVPSNANEDFKRKVFAAAKSYYLGIKSTDYTLKKYGDLWDFNESIEITIVNNMVKDIKSLIIDCLNYVMGIDNKPDVPNLYFSGAALIRLQNTFKATLLCIKSNLHFEAMGLQRMILEQLAWIYHVHNHEELFMDIESKRTISYLKDLLPRAGKLYGYFSEGIHLSPKLIVRYVEKDLTIKMGDIRHTAIDALYLCELADYYCIISEYIYAQYQLINDYKYLILEDDVLKVNPKRESKKLMEKYKDIIERELFNKEE